jgi:AhpD family alkylhydroperoxidase
LKSGSKGGFKRPLQKENKKEDFKMADEKRWFEKRAPEMAKGWWDFYNAVEGETALDKKTKALIAVSVAVHGRCPHCSESRIKKAIALGISKEEIAETIMMTALLSSGTDIFWIRDTYEKYLG